MLLKLAWRNLWRNRNRTLITMASVMFAVLLSVFVQSLQTGVFDNLIKNVVNYYTSYIQIHTKGYYAEQTLDNAMSIDKEWLKKIKQVDNVSYASQRIETFVLASGSTNTRGCLVNGVEPEPEKQLIQLHEKVVSGNYLNHNEAAVLIGVELAKKLNLKVNDTIVLLGQGYQGSTAAGKFLVKGLLKFGSPELNDKMLFMPLAACREFLSMQNQATTIAVSIKNPKQLNRTRDALTQTAGNSYEVLTWEDLMPEIIEHMKTDKAGGVIMSLMLYLLVSFGIFSTLLMMMAERRFEFGMLVAIGMKKLQLAQMMILESLFVTAAGSATGLLVSIPVVWYFKVFPIRFGPEFAKIYEQYGFEAVIPTSTDPMIFAQQTAIVILISLVLSLYPLIKILSLNPVNAMKR